MDAKQLENLTQEQLLNLFVEQLIKDKGLEVTENLKKELIDKISKKINLLTVKSLPDEDLKKLNDELDGGKATDESIMKIVNGAGVNMEEVTERALKEFREEYLGKKSESNTADDTKRKEA